MSFTVSLRSCYMQLGTVCSWHIAQALALCNDGPRNARAKAFLRSTPFREEQHQWWFRPGRPNQARIQPSTLLPFVIIVVLLRLRSSGIRSRCGGRFCASNGRRLVNSLSVRASRLDVSRLLALVADTLGTRLGRAVARQMPNLAT